MQAKEDLFELCKELWGVELTGRSDLHCYFWPASTAFLKDNGWFGFLVSSSWLDVEYGFALQEWVLTHFKIHAILESNAEPWFEDARVKTCAVILQRCDDPKERNEHLVKFVRLDAPLAEILGERSDENSRQTAAEKFRDIISRCKQDTARKQFRIVVVPQKKLWEDGLRAGKLFALQKQRDLAEGVVHRASDDENEENGKTYDENGNGYLHDGGGIGYGPKYGGGKWGKYLRAPESLFSNHGALRQPVCAAGRNCHNPAWHHQRLRCFLHAARRFPGLFGKIFKTGMERRPPAHVTASAAKLSPAM